MVFTVSELKAIHNLATIYCSFCYQPITNLNTHLPCLNSLAGPVTCVISSMICFICQADLSLQKEINTLEVKNDRDEKYSYGLILYICPTCNETQDFLESLLEN